MRHFVSAGATDKVTTRVRRDAHGDPAARGRQRTDASAAERPVQGAGMRPEQWETFKRAARLEKLDEIPMALIVDSPWIPGYLGIAHMDYFLDPELWFQANLKIIREF